jgi:hypothetical protein
MPWVGFEPTIPASEREKVVHILDRSATVTGYLLVNAGFSDSETFHGKAQII